MPPICEECGYSDEARMCGCENWFCDHCGWHIDGNIDKVSGRICWAGAA